MAQLNLVPTLQQFDAYSESSSIGKSGLNNSRSSQSRQTSRIRNKSERCFYTFVDLPYKKFSKAWLIRVMIMIRRRRSLMNILHRRKIFATNDINLNKHVNRTVSQLSNLLRDFGIWLKPVILNRWTLLSQTKSWLTATLYV